MRGQEWQGWNQDGEGHIKSMVSLNLQRNKQEISGGCHRFPLVFRYSAAPLLSLFFSPFALPLAFPLSTPKSRLARAPLGLPVGGTTCALA